MADKQGLYVKYHVTKIEDGSVVNGCFVLRPDKDAHARAALRAYAASTDNAALSEDLHTWMEMLDPAPDRSFMTAPPAEREEEW